MPKGLAHVGYILALIGGIILVITGGLRFLGVFFTLPVTPGLAIFFGDLVRDFFTVALGIVAIIGSRYVHILGWAIALIVIGLIVSDLGGLLVLVGGILGLVNYFYRKR